MFTRSEKKPPVFLDILLFYVSDSGEKKAAVGFYSNGDSNNALNKYDLPDGYFEDGISDVSFVENVTHWMYLPSPPID